MPRFSIVIPTYNRAELVGEAIRSALQQTFENYEIMVVENGSSDHTLEVLERYRGQVQILPLTHNRGAGGARNLAAKRATGDYLLMLDSDDLLFPWALATLERIIHQGDHPTLVLHNPFRFRHLQELERVKREDPAVDYWPDYLAAAHKKYRAGPGAVLSRRSFLACGGYLEKDAGEEDEDLFLRLGTKPGYAYLHAPFLYAHRQATPGSITGNLIMGYRGIRELLARDKRGIYPGGRQRRAEREKVLVRLLRSTVRRCFRRGRHLLGIDLYLRGYRYFLRQGNSHDLTHLPLMPFRRLASRIKRRLEHLLHQERSSGKA